MTKNEGLLSMRILFSRLTLSALTLALTVSPLAAKEPTSVPSHITAAIADASRPDADRARDANRKPAKVLAFAGLKPGDKVADYAAGGGYFTRILAGAVGPAGHVYASVPNELFKFESIVKGIAELQKWSVDHRNVSVIAASALPAARYPEKLDLFWISLNYHDLHVPFMGPVDISKFNKAVYDALKPGGTYLIVDHVAAKGSPTDVTDTLHRIEPDVVRREVEAAGFKFAGESSILANPTDPHSADPFDASIRGRTDQFIYKFRKP